MQVAWEPRNGAVSLKSWLFNPVIDGFPSVRAFVPASLSLLCWGTQQGRRRPERPENSYCYIYWPRQKWCQTTHKQKRSFIFFSNSTKTRA